MHRVGGSRERDQRRQNPPRPPARPHRSRGRPRRLGCHRFSRLLVRRLQSSVHTVEPTRLRLLVHSAPDTATRVCARLMGQHTGVLGRGRKGEEDCGHPGRLVRRRGGRMHVQTPASAS